MVTPPHRPLLAPSLIQFSSKYLRAGRCGRVSQVALVGKNLSANAAGVRDVGLIPGLGRYPGGGNGNFSSILAWRIPWTEEPGGLQSMGSQRVGHD